MKILCVSENAHLRHYLTLQIESTFDYEIMEANELNECLAIIHVESDFNLIVLDVPDSGESVTSILKFLSDYKLDIPFIFLQTPTNLFSQPVLSSIQNSKFHDMIELPVKEAEFFNLVEKAISFNNEITHKQSLLDDDLDDILDSFDESDWEKTEDEEDIKEEETKTFLSMEGIKATEKLKRMIRKIQTNETRTQLMKGRRKRSEETALDNDFNTQIYKRIKIGRFHGFESAPCDVFLKLPKDKYLKIIQSKDPYDPLQLQKYEDKGVRYVFILINDYPHLISELNNSLLSNLKSAFKAGGDISKSAEITAFDLVMDAAVEIGVSKETAKTMKLVVSKSIESAKQNADLSHLLTLMMNGGSFKSEHSLTLSYVTGQICMAMGSQYEEALESLAIASLMHDSALEDDKLCKMHDSPDFNLRSVSEDIREVIEFHSPMSADIMTKNKNIFPNVDLIILQHHETPEGDGYPRGLGSSSIAIESGIFIIAEEFVKRVYGKKRNEFSIKEIKDDFINRFSQGNFKTPLEGFLNAF